MKPPNTSYEVLIIGAGPAGMTLAQNLARAGKKVAVFEKEHFPRYHIGESLLPATMPILTELGIKEELEKSAVKKPGGVWIYGYDKNGKALTTGGAFSGCTRSASFKSEPHAFMVERDRFDSLLVDRAKSLGVEVRFGTKVTEIIGDQNCVKGLVVKSEDSPQSESFTAQMVYDCSGMTALIGRKFGLRKKNGLKKMAVFAQVKCVPTSPLLQQGYFLGHVLNGGWSWYIPLRENKISIGLVLPSDQIKKGCRDLNQFFLKELSKIQGFSKEVSGSITLASDVKMTANFGENSTRNFGPGWALVGDAAFFIDPCFSSGVHLSMTHAKKLADVYNRYSSQSEDFTKSMNSQDQEIQSYLKNTRTAVDIFYLSSSNGFTRWVAVNMFFGYSKKAFMTTLGGDFDKNVLFMKSAYLTTLLAYKVGKVSSHLRAIIFKSSLNKTGMSF